MLIHSDMLQKLVDKIISDIGYNINIIDSNGIIIASGSKERIGKFHKAGRQAADNKCRIDIHKADANMYSDVKSGINLPFYYKETLIGVIGITGEPSQIRELANIVKSMIELMYEQELLKQKMYYRQNNKVFFINELINITNREALVSIKSWGAKLGYDMSVRRGMIIIQFLPHKNSEALLSTEDMTQDFIRNLKSIRYHHKNDISTFLSANRIVIVKASYTEDHLIEAAHIQEYIQEITKFIKNTYPLNFIIGVGSYYDDLYQLKESFFEAEFIINKTSSHSDHQVGFISDYLLSYFSSRLPEGIKEHFFEESYNKLKEIPDAIETILSLVRNNMHITHCASELYIHRNTVLFRLNKIKELLHSDPVNNPSDRAFWMLLAEYSLSKNINN